MGLLPSSAWQHVGDEYLDLEEHVGKFQVKARSQSSSSGSRRVRYAAQVAMSASVFFFSVSLVPILNKRVFLGNEHVQKFPYPVAMAFLQLGAVSLVLGAVDLALQCLRCGGLTLQAWPNRPHLAYKLRHAGPVGVCFGLKYAVTNWGLQLVPTATHLLLQATDLLWTVAFARLINKEQTGPVECLAVLLSTCGTILVSLDLSQSLTAPLVPLLVNLLTPIALALCVTTLRNSVKVLMTKDGILEDGMGAVELTSIKLAFSATTAFIVAFVMEGGFVWPSWDGVVLQEASAPTPWWEALSVYPREGLVIIFVGCLSILMFQVNLTWLTRLTSSVCVGMVGSAKVLPQWFMNDLFGTGVHLTEVMICGAGLIFLSCGLFVSARCTDPWEVQEDEGI